MKADDVTRFLTPKMDIKEAYTRGYDAGLHGSNDTNTNFAIFSSEENSTAWSEGKNDAKTGKPNKYKKQ